MSHRRRKRREPGPGTARLLRCALFEVGHSWVGSPSRSARVGAGLFVLPGATADAKIGQVMSAVVGEAGFPLAGRGLMLRHNACG